MLKRKILGALIGISVFAAAPVVVSEITGAPVLYASASEVASASDFTVTPNSDGKTAVLSAYTGKATDIEIPSTVTVDAVTYTVTGIGENTFKNKTTITNIVIPDTVTSIGANAFNGCTKITSITIPDSVQTLGSSVFYNCTGLTTVSLPSNIRALPEKAFYGCTKLATINIPDSILSLGSYAFYGCRALTAIHIPTGISTIPTYAFYGSGLTSVTIPSNIKTIEGYAFANCASLVTVNVPDASEKDGYITIASTAFNSCPKLDFSYFTYEFISENNNASIKGIIGQKKNLILPSKIAGYDVVTTEKEAFKGKTFIETVTIPEGIRTLGIGTFSGCTSLKSVTLPSTMSVISASAFEGCTALQTAPLIDPDPNDDCNIEIVEIGEKAFKGCTMLSDVQFPTTLNKIGANAFYGCSAITTITMPDNIRTLGDSAFQLCTNLSQVKLSSSLRTIPKAAFQGCTALTSIVIPEDVEEIADGTDKLGAFQSSGLKSVTLPDRLGKIGAFAFKDTPLTSVTMKNGVTTLGKSCFEACKSLGSVTLSEGLTSISERAFADCTSLTTVEIPEKVTAVMKEAFSCFDAKTYSGSGSLSSVTLPKNLLTIGDTAFAGHAPLKSIELSDTITAIGSGAFRNTGLTKVTLPTNSKFTTLNKAVFSDCTDLSEVIIPENVTYIGDAGTVINDGTFYSCISLESIDLPSKLTKIGACAFAHCLSLKEIVIPDLVTAVGNYSFYDCRTMTDVNIGAKVQSLGTYAFEHCLALTEVEIPSTVKTLGAGLFSACDSLKKLTTNADLVNNAATKNKSAYQILFYSDSTACLSTFYGGDQNLVNHALQEVVFNSGVTTIGDYSFGGAEKLKRITIADTVTRIGIEAFYNCKELVFVSTIPRSVTEISDYAFSGCPNLKAIVIPKTVTTFGYKVFAGDTGLTIFGESGSEAETYANNDNENIPFVNIYQNIQNAKAEIVSGAVSLTWDKISDTIEANGQTYKIDKIVYHIYRSDSSNEKTKIADVETNYYTDTAVVFGSTYSYSISCTYCFTAKNGEEYTIDSSEVNLGSVTVEAPKVKNITATPGDGKVTLSWDALTGATNYTVLVKNGTSWKTLGATGKNTTYTATGLVNGETYYFVVKAYVNGTWTGPSDTVSATPEYSIIPQNVKASAGDSKVTLTWDAVEGATNYAVFLRKGTAWLKIGASGANTTFTSRGLANGGKYFYMVKSYVNGAWSGESATVFAIPVCITPQNVKASAGDSKVTLTWDAVKGASNYAVFLRKGTAWLKIGSSGASTTFTSRGLANGGKYFYMVKAYVNGSWSDESAVVSAMPVCITPQNVKAVGGTGEATITWDAVTGASNYVVLVKKGTSWVTLGAAGTKTTYTAKDLTGGETYYFVVKAYVNGAWSDMSETVSASVS
ncbi:MAG: leucine-rich repeat protein [Oscillospiraceae bacterium]|nr:leucine-rich repeat protein [Oscillospiraceae bacterium]